MRARLRLTWQESLFSVVVTAITLAGTALVLIVGGLHVMNGTLTLGSLLVVIAYLAAVYDPISAIAHSTGSLQQAVASARRVRAIFALTPEVLDALDSRFESFATGSTDTFRDRAHALLDCIQKLSDRLRQVIELAYGRGMSLREVAATIDEQEDAVRKRAQRARNQLYDCLQHMNG